MGEMSTAAAAGRKLILSDVATRAALLSFGSNALLMVLKLAAGFAFGSVAVVGDGIDSAEDVFASGLTFFTVRLALQPADLEHPYGHGKAESLSAMSQAALIFGGSVFITVAAVRRLLAEEADVMVGPSLAVMGMTVAANLLVAWYALHAARVSGSVAIAADARHLLTNVVQAAAVIVGLALVGLTGRHAFDPIVALALAAYLAWIALGIFREALSELVDTALPPAEVAGIEQLLSRPEHGMRGFHELRTRKSGREKHIDLHLLVDPAITVSEAHQLVDELEEEIRGAIPEAVVTIHVDPDEPGLSCDRSAAPGADTGIHFHRHRAASGEGVPPARGA